MRWFLATWLALLMATGAAAQRRQATLELEDGRVLSGRVVQMDARHVLIEQDGRIITVDAADIRHSEFRQAAPSAAADQVDAVTTADGADGSFAAGLVAKVLGNGPSSLLTERWSRFGRRYPWLMTSEPLQWGSLLLAALAIVSLAVNLAGGLAGSEVRTFGRSVVIALWVFVATVAQVALVPITGPMLLGMLLGNGVALMLMFRWFHGLTSSSAIGAILVLLVELGVAVGALELVNATLRSIGNAAA